MAAEKVTDVPRRRRGASPDDGVGRTAGPPGFPDYNAPVALDVETQPASAVQLRIDWGIVARHVLRSRLLDDVEEAELAPAGEVPYQFSARRHELAQPLPSPRTARPA